MRGWVRGPSTLDNQFGDIIDTFDNVARINNYKTSNFENCIGSKTTIWFNGANKKLTPRPEFEGKIRFLTANLNSSEGKWFAEYHNVGRVTLLFFKPNGTKISSLSGEQTPDDLRRVFNRVFELE